MSGWVCYAAVLMCLMVSSTYGLELVNLTQTAEGQAVVSWKASGLENLRFSILYGIGQDNDGPEIEWQSADDLPCCTATIGQLQMHTVYTFKVAVNVDSEYLASNSKIIPMHTGVPFIPHHLTMRVYENKNLTDTWNIRLTWEEKERDAVEFYNISVHLRCIDTGHKSTLTEQTRDTSIIFKDIPKMMSIGVRVIAVNQYGNSNHVSKYHTAVNTLTAKQLQGVFKGFFWVILGAVLISFTSIAAIALGIYYRRRRSHLNVRRSKANNGLSYMPLQLSREKHDSLLSQQSLPPRWASGVAGHGGVESPRNNIHRTSLQEGRSEVNRIGRGCETSPHKAHFQLVSESPQIARLRAASLGRDGVSSAASPRADLLMSTPPGSPRSSKRMPIIPLSEEKLVGRVSTDPSRYPSCSRVSSFGN